MICKLFQNSALQAVICFLHIKGNRGGVLLFLETFLYVIHQLVSLNHTVEGRGYFPETTRASGVPSIQAICRGYWFKDICQ